MTATTPASTTTSGLSDRYVTWLLTARQNPQIRGALRRGDIPSADARAYPYLARFWAQAPYLRTPILLHAATAAAHTKIPHRQQTTLGNLAADLVSRGVISRTTVAARLLAVQRMDLPVAHRHFSGLLHAAAASQAGLDWRQLFQLYRSWDHRYSDLQLRTRRALLEDFHTRHPG